MFFKMLKRDLTDKIGLNIVIFIFITVAAGLVFLGSVQLYSGFTAEKYNREICKMCVTEFTFLTGKGNREEKTARAEQIMKETINRTNEIMAEEGKPLFEEPRYTKSLMLNARTIDFANFDEAEDNNFSYYGKYLVPLPLDANLIYDSDDKPFYVENGKIAVPKKVADNAGAKIGDKVKYTTQDGYIYEFEISVLTKDPLSDYINRFRFVISDADFELLMQHNTDIFTSYSFLTPKNPEVYGMMLSDLIAGGDIRITTARSTIDEFTNSHVFNYILVVFIMLISFFLILVVLMTVRFTMVASIKEQEKEIGTMKAIGSDTFAFRWLFCAKYIAFAIVGGILGIGIAVPFSGYVSDIFTPENISPETYVMVIIGVVSAVTVMGAIILFSLFVMRRINKISPVDAIRGENRGERFGRGFAFYLHKRRIMSEGFSLALSDVLGRAKRYIFLIIVYILGTTIMLTTFNLKNSVISEDFLKYDLIYNSDFCIDIDDDMYDEIILRTGITDIDEALNQDFRDHGIPAELDYCECNSIELIIDGETDPLDLYLFFNTESADKLDYKKGGSAPVLENEIAISSFTAKKYDLKVGQRIKALVLTSDNGVDINEEEREYVISGLVNYMENGYGLAILGGVQDDLYSRNNSVLGYNINTDEAEKAAVIEQMKEIYGEKAIMNAEEAVIDWIGTGYKELFDLLMIIMGSMVIFITILVTYLCSTVFISEETADIALMKSMGLSSRIIRSQYVFRFVILLVAAIPLAILLLNTGIQAFVGELFAFLELSGFKFMPEYPVTFGAIPLIMSVTVITVAMLKINSTEKIYIREISEE